MNLTLRLLLDSDLPDLQRIYETLPERFRLLTGGPAGPEQAARDFVDALQTPGRNQFGVLYGENLIGMADCKLDDEEEGVAHIGLILLAPPYDDAEIMALLVRILERWFASEYGVRRVEVGVLAHAPAELDFWTQQGYQLTGGQYRRELPNYNPRFLVMMRALS